jgi:hypothetical protein
VLGLAEACLLGVVGMVPTRTSTTSEGDIPIALSSSAHGFGEAVVLGAGLHHHDEVALVALGVRRLRTSREEGPSPVVLLARCPVDGPGRSRRPSEKRVPLTSISRD